MYLNHSLITYIYIYTFKLYDFSLCFDFRWSELKKEMNWRKWMSITRQMLNLLKIVILVTYRNISIGVIWIQNHHLKESFRCTYARSLFNINSVCNPVTFLQTGVSSHRLTLKITKLYTGNHIYILLLNICRWHYSNLLILFHCKIRNIIARRNRCLSNRRWEFNSSVLMNCK